MNQKVKEAISPRVPQKNPEVFYVQYGHDACDVVDNDDDGAD